MRLTTKIVAIPATGQVTVQCRLGELVRVKALFVVFTTAAAGADGIIISFLCQSQEAAHVSSLCLQATDGNVGAGLGVDLRGPSQKTINVATGAVEYDASDATEYSMGLPEVTWNEDVTIAIGGINTASVVNGALTYEHTTVH